MFKVFIFTALISVSSSFAQAELADPDLSFDGFAMVIEQIEFSRQPSPDCTTLSEDLRLYKEQEQKNHKINVVYGERLAEVFKSWSAELEKLKNKSVKFADGTLEPVKSLRTNLIEARDKIESNSETVGFFLYDLREIADECDISDSLLSLLENYEDNVSLTNSEYEQYLRKLQPILVSVEATLKSFNQSRPKVFDGEVLELLTRYSSAEVFSGGLGEALYWFRRKFKEVYAEELNFLLESLESEQPKPTE